MYDRVAHKINTPQSTIPEIHNSNDKITNRLSLRLTEQVIIQIRSV